jgi:hypothetical protein
MQEPLAALFETHGPEAAALPSYEQCASVGFGLGLSVCGRANAVLSCPATETETVLGGRFRSFNLLRPLGGEGESSGGIPIGDPPHRTVSVRAVALHRGNQDHRAYLQSEQPKVLPKSPIGQAISYTLSNWKAVVRYAADGALEIDNNGAERSLRGTAVGRKSWMFYGSDDGGKTAAVVSSLVASCKRLHIDPFVYLRDIFGRISSYPANRLARLLPNQWKAAQVANTSCP